MNYIKELRLIYRKLALKDYDKYKPILDRLSKLSLNEDFSKNFVFIQAKRIADNL